MAEKRTPKFGTILRYEKHSSDDHEPWTGFLKC